MTEIDFGIPQSDMTEDTNLLRFEQKDKIKVIETAKGKLHFELSMLTLDCALIEAKVKEIQGVMMRNEREI